MSTESFGTIAIVVMAIIVYATRIAGAELMGLVRLTPRVESVLKAMATSVLIALVASECVRGGLGQVLAVLVAALAMSMGRGPVVAMMAGVASAAAYSWVFA